MNTRLNLWKAKVQIGETEKTPRLRKFYEREPDLPPPEQESPTEPAQASPSSDTLEAGSWEQPVAAPVARETPSADRRRGKRPYERIAKNKVRRHNVSISVSEEEEDLLRLHAAKLDMSFSSWARQVLFRALGRKTPERVDTSA